MFRKVIYFIMMSVGLIGLLSIFVLPIYKFVPNDILINYNEYHFIIDTMDTSDSSIELLPDYEIIFEYDSANAENYKNATSAEKKAFKELYYKRMNNYHAVMTKDYDSFKCDELFDIYNSLKQSLLNKLLKIESPNHSATNAIESLNGIEELTEESSDATLEAFKFCLNMTIGVLKDYSIISEEQTLDNLVDNESHKVLDAKYEKIINYLGGEEKAKDTITDVAVIDVMQHLFLQYDGINDAEELEIQTNKYKEKGIKLVNVLGAWQNLIDRYKVIWTAGNEAGLGFGKKMKNILSYSYKPWSLILVSLVLILFVYYCIKIFFGGLKGINGRKRPKTFISSVIIAGIGVLLLFSMTIISYKNIIGYHSIQWSKLLYLFCFGKFSYGIIIPSIAAIISIIVTFFGVFCKFGKREKEE